MEQFTPPPSKKNTQMILMSGIGVLTLAIGSYLALSSTSGSLGAPKASPTPETKAFEGSMLKIDADGEALEGRAETLQLALTDAVSPTTLTLETEEISYLGKPVAHRFEIDTQDLPKALPLVFQSPGQKKVFIKDAKGNTLKTVDYKVEPFAASVFPKAWEEHPKVDLAEGQDNPYKIFVNLYYNPKESPEQRQYLQVTYKGEIVDRFLVSSGAVGHDTPQGQFNVGFKDFYPRSAKYGNTPMPFWSSIKIDGKEGEYGFHSLEDGGYLYLLGKPASHGCVRLSRKASVETDPETGKKFWGDRGGARWIYDRIPEDTPVTIMSHKRPAFEYQDYHKYLVAEAKAYAEKQAQKKKVKQTAAQTENAEQPQAPQNTNT